MTSWMNSAGHKANILNCGFKNLGVGVAADARGSLLWTQDFGQSALTAGRPRRAQRPRPAAAAVSGRGRRSS